LQPAFADINSRKDGSVYYTLASKFASLQHMGAGKQQGEELLAAVVELARQRWRERLIAAYALGSLAHGGFSPVVSDIDVGLVLDDPLLGSDSDSVMELASSLKAANRPFADRLSVFWGSVASLSGASPGGRFPPLDRLDLKKFGRLLAGRDVRSALPVPTHRELVLAAAEFALWRLATDEVIAKLKDAHALARSDPKTLTKLILFPVRFMFTARTGEVGRNEAAVEHFVAAAKSAASDLARLALEWRNAAPRPSDQDAIHAIADGAIPLYEEFLLDHERRMREYGRMDLAEAFHAWRQKLQA
jgi:predicted nucleotidyltransferase